MKNTILREIAFVLILVIATAVSVQVTQAEKDKALQYLDVNLSND